MKLAIMQPYFFPYIGYFQLIKAVDKFIFYDDVSYIKNGWINRNRILINGHSNYFTVPLKDASSFKQINEIDLSDNRQKLLKTIKNTYPKAPFYNSVFPIIEDCLTSETKNISELAIDSVQRVCDYLNLNTTFEISSNKYPETKGLEKAERLKTICKYNNSTTYINPIGGMELYDKDDFKKDNIHLYFLKGRISEYHQFSKPFIPGLSIIDVMMFNSVEKIHEMLDNYELM